MKNSLCKCTSSHEVIEYINRVLSRLWTPYPKYLYLGYKELVVISKYFNGEYSAMISELNYNQMELIKVDRDNHFNLTV